MITTVTLTGADDSVKPLELLALSQRYPFAEWGILVSGKRYGTNRFPSKEWITALLDAVPDYPDNKIFKLSCHLCGQYVKDILTGNQVPMNDLGFLWEMFDRVQINTHGIPHPYSAEAFKIFSSEDRKEFILQYDEVNQKILIDALCTTANVSTLFDMSHGAGVVPKEWPEPFKTLKCGYAGGISPDNIVEQIKLIESHVGNTPVWIDMETHVRSQNDLQFDLDKVETCLKLSEKYVTIKA